MHWILVPAGFRLPWFPPHRYPVTICDRPLEEIMPLLFQWRLQFFHILHLEGHLTPRSSASRSGEGSPPPPEGFSVHHPRGSDITEFRPSNGVTSPFFRERSNTSSDRSTGRSETGRPVVRHGPVRSLDIGPIRVALWHDSIRQGVQHGRMMGRLLSSSFITLSLSLSFQFFLSRIKPPGGFLGHPQ